MGFVMYDSTRFSSLCVNRWGGGGVRGGFIAIQTCIEHDARSSPLLSVLILF